MVLPIAKLKFHVAPLWLARLCSQGTGEVIAVHGQDFANVAAANAHESFPLWQRVTPAKTTHKLQFFGARVFNALNDNLRASGVGEHGFLTENIFARVHRGAQMHGAKVWSGCQNHHVHIAGARQLARVKASEATLWWNHDARTFWTFCKFRVRAFNAVGECVGHDPNHNSGIGFQRLLRGASAAATTANERHFNLATASGLSQHSSKYGRGDGRGASHGRGVDELSTLKSFIIGLLHA